MSEPYLGEIRPVGFNFAPEGWAFCDGQLLQIAENDALFALLGTTYGGDGQSTFALPNLQGRVAIHKGNSFFEGQDGGTETVTLTTNQIPVHVHAIPAESDTAGATSSPANAHFGASTQKQYAAGGTANAAPGLIQLTGGSQPHDNMPPYLAINYIIALEGIFPTQS